ncbi:MAG: response regulator [Candidatus Binatia bacterium]
MAPMRVLVVDDNLDSRRILVYRLRRLGIVQIAEASNGAEALRIIRSDLPDLIMMDLKMPVMDGWEATRAIRLEFPERHIPIMAITAQAMAGDERKALAAGCDDYLAKPIVDADVIAQKIQRLVPGWQPEARRQ